MRRFSLLRRCCRSAARATWLAILKSVMFPVHLARIQAFSLLSINARYDGVDVGVGMKERT